MIPARYAILLSLFSGVLFAFSPTSVEAQQNVGLSWDPSPSSDIAGYNVYYGSESGNYTTLISVGNSTNAQITGLAGGMTYYFAVSAYGSSGQESELSNEVTYTVPGIAPPVAIASIQKSFSGQSMTVTWIPSPSADVVGYNVYFGTQSGYYPDYISVSGANQADIYGVEDGVTYYVVITAYDSSGHESVYSSESSYTIPTLAAPGPITSIQQQAGSDAVALTWNPSPSADVAAYYVYLSPYDGYYFSAVAVSYTNQATVYGLIRGATYYFYITALDSSWQESSPSAQSSYTVPLLDPPGAITSIQQTDQGVAVNWNPSPNPAAMGYNIYYGPYSGYYTGVISVSGATNATLYGLEASQTYYFVVTAWDDSGQESAPSGEASYTLPEAVVTGPVLTLQQLPIAGFQNAFAITSSDAMPSSWTLEASSDLQTWSTLTTGSDPSLNVTVLVSTKPALFFRLDSSYSDIELQIQNSVTNGFPQTLSVTTPYPVPWWWTLESSEDLQNWNPLTTGYYSSVNLAVVTAPVSAMYFRLKSE